jgi:hypothetical protein
LKKSYIEEQDDLKKIFKTINVDNDEDEDLFYVKNKSKEEKVISNRCFQNFSNTKNMTHIYKLIFEGV